MVAKVKEMNGGGERMENKWDAFEILCESFVISILSGFGMYHLAYYVGDTNFNLSLIASFLAAGLTTAILFVKNFELSELEVKLRRKRK